MTLIHFIGFSGVLFPFKLWEFLDFPIFLFFFLLVFGCKGEAFPGGLFNCRLSISPVGEVLQERGRGLDLRGCPFLFFFRAPRLNLILHTHYEAQSRFWYPYRIQLLARVPTT